MSLITCLVCWCILENMSLVLVFQPPQGSAPFGFAITFTNECSVKLQEFQLKHHLLFLSMLRWGHLVQSDFFKQNGQYLKGFL